MSQQTLESYLKTLHRKYGPTFPVDCSVAERGHLLRLQAKTDFVALSVNGACDEKGKKCTRK